MLYDNSQSGHYYISCTRFNKITQLVTQWHVKMCKHLCAVYSRQYISCHYGVCLTFQKHKKMLFNFARGPKTCRLSQKFSKQVNKCKTHCKKTCFGFFVFTAVHFMPLWGVSNIPKAWRNTIQLPLYSENVPAFSKVFKTRKPMQKNGKKTAAHITPNKHHYLALSKN